MFRLKCVSGYIEPDQGLPIILEQIVFTCLILIIVLLQTEKQKIEERNKLGEEDMARLTKEKEKTGQIISELKQELEIIKRTYEEQFQQMETKAKEYQTNLEQKLKDAKSSLAESQRRIKELGTISESKFQNWNQRELVLQSFIDLQLQSVQVYHAQACCNLFLI